MKCKELMLKIGMLTLSTVFTSNFLLQPTTLYAYNLIANLDENSSLEDSYNVNGYNQIGGVESYKKSRNKVTLKMTTGEKVRVSFLEEGIFRIYMDPTGEFQEEPTPNGKDHITKIIYKQEDEYQKVSPKVEDGDIIKISTELIELRIEKATGKMELFNKALNKVIWKEAEPLKYKSNETVQTLETNNDEYFYGGGQQNGRFSHKGKTINIRNENNWVDGGVSSPTPFYFSTNGYGVMRHTFKPGQYAFSSNEKNKVITTHEEKRFDAYYFIDENPINIINEFTELTGKPILLPEYGFYLGHANCYSRDWINDETGQESQTQRPGFDRQESLMVDAKKVIDEHVENDTPIGWFLPNDGYGCGYGRENTIDGNINNLKEFVDYSRSKGIQTGLWTQSDLKPTGNGEVYLERDIDKEVGVAGTNGVKTDVAWVGAGYSFALNSVRQAAEGIINNSKDNARPFIVSLDGWAGTQRYAGLWSGDQYGGNWEYIRFHIPTYIGSGLSGQPNVGSDMDGIFGGNNLIQTRDFQWKTFTPIKIDMDGWGSNAKNPYVFGEPYTSINRMYLKLKAEMMPYNYSIANEASNTGMPMVRAMMLEDANPYTYGTDTQYQYMWGPNLLVAPIYENTSADAQGNDIRNGIYLPDEEQIWIDYFTGNQYRGGGVLNNFDAPMWKVPVFVKNGAIIPMSNENNSPEYIDDSQRILEVYPSGETSFEIYEDDGLTTDYTSGKSATTMITSSAPKTGKGKAIITAEALKGNYEGIVTERTTEFIVNVSEKPTDLSLEIGNNNISLTEVNTMEEFENGTNVYFYDKSPNLNKYATAGSEFEKVEIITTPKLYVKTEKTNVKQNKVKLTINDFVNTQEIAKNEENTSLNSPLNFRAPEEEITPESIKLEWDNVEGATSYDVEIDGVIFKNININSYIDTELNFDTEYSYRVRAVNNDGYSKWSEKIIVRTALDPHRNVPKDMTINWTEGHYGSEEPNNAIDGNDTTQFHSAGNAIDKPVIFDMKKAYQIEKLDLLFRANGNGSVKRAEIYSSLDGITYEKVFSNASDSENPAWTTDGTVKAIEFKKPIKARYFKIVTKESIGNFIAMREFRPYKVDGTNGQVVGDWNNGGTIEEGDLTFLENYNGLSSVDADWDYVSMADLNLNKIIDSYDISYVASKLQGGIVPTEGGKVSGEIMLIPSKSEILANETFTIDVVGTGLSDMNAFSAEIPLDPNKYELVGTPEATVSTASMSNLSKLRLHSDNSQHIYVTFTNVGDNVKVSGTETIARVTLKAKKDISFDMEMTHALIVDSNLNSKAAIGKITDPEAPLPEGAESISKITKESITVIGDESQLQQGMGLNKLIDGTTSSDDSSRMDLKWIYNADQVDKGTLPFKMTFQFNEPKTFDNFIIYNRINSKGSNNISALKKVKAIGYLNGVETDLGEKANITTSQTKYELNNQQFDKIVITALECNKDIHTLAINEIEFYEKKGVDPTEIKFAEDTQSQIYPNKLVPISANVLPDNSNNLNYRITSSNEEIIKVIRVDSDNTINYYLKGVNPGVATITATTADGKLNDKKEIIVTDGLDKTLLIETIEKAKSYASLSEIYTQETYSVLVKAIENAENLLESAKTESELSAAIISLRTAINGLKERDTVEEDIIDFNKLTAIDATSEADRDFKENAIDGDENTIWHSSYQAADTLPVSITVELDKAYTLNQIDYMPRQNSINGHITEYRVETSLDNENWTEARTGTLKESSNGTGLLDRGYNPIRFNTVKAKYVKFTALKTLGGTPNKYASVAELRFYGQSAPVAAESITLNKESLSLKANTSEKLIAKLNPVESNDNIIWSSSDESIAAVDENGNVTAIEVGKATITAAIPNGIKATATITVIANRDELDTEIIEAEKIMNEENAKDKYSISSWKVFEDAYNSAKVLGEDATQKEINNVKDTLKSAREGLSPRTNKDELKVKIEEGKVFLSEANKYSKATLKVLAVAIENAEAILASDASTEDDFSAANKAITISIEGLFDITDINKVLEEASSKVEEEYTPISYLEFINAKAELQSLLERDDVDSKTLEDSKAKLQNKMNQLVKRADKLELNNIIKDAEKLVENDYTPASFEIFKKALESAKQILADLSVTQDQVNEAISILEDSIKNLIEKDDTDLPVEIDKTKLEKLISDANKLKQPEYTKETWNKFKDALNNAIKVFENKESTQKDIDDAVKLLKESMNSLKKISAGGNTNNNQNSTTGGGKGNNGTDLPNTGGIPSTAVGVFGLLSSILGLGIIKRRKK
ncbi:discoidin domain-containing protein [Clostridium chauvoei]|uniref:discoidin domain-containing protein n=1 Tax=Clostridium chauvoei TaxID=46867 RepID=UPI001C858B26|nr:discoidin domain-containing protein [Clostridium chauvoei]MBX7328194.1 discoidin domain-containing protein [Clostridium chauvoei]